MNQLDLFSEPETNTEPVGFTDAELSTLRTERLVSAVRTLGDMEFFAARDAVKHWRVEPEKSPLFEFFSLKLSAALEIVRRVS